jgi:hypothetical protein
MGTPPHSWASHLWGTPESKVTPKKCFAGPGTCRGQKLLGHLSKEIVGYTGSACERRKQQQNTVTAETKALHSLGARNAEYTSVESGECELMQAGRA